MRVFAKLFGTGAASQTDIDVREAHRRYRAGALMVDVRELHEWLEHHIEGALHLPLGELMHRLHELPRDREILLICRSGNRSGRALRLLQAQGFERVSNVSGGMLSWLRAQLPAVRL
ncbi:MAG: rhodanese-like domain-containing protein [Chloroflexi bacterium]|nr:rhodanese-like domain-containing protein [Chloroflexota bacterium]